jgi:hypothetical protein
MGFVSFLKKAGQILANVAAVEAGLEPIFKANLPASASPAIDKLDLVFKQVVAIEGAFAAAYPGQQTGPQKVLAAASLVGPVLQSVDTITGKPIANEAAYVKAVQTISGGFADLLNSLGSQPSSATVAGSVIAAGTSASGVTKTLAK